MTRTLRVATWNFGYGSIGSPSKNRKETVLSALEYLKKNNVDIVLAQEIFDTQTLQHAYPNQIYSDIPIYNPQGCGEWGKIDYSKYTHNDNKRAKWGTAILSTADIELSPIDLKYNTAYPGSMTCAQINDTDIALISLYGKNTYDYEKVTGYSYLANLHRCLSDASPLLDGFYLAKRFIVAGDWNAGPQWDSVKSRKNYNFFDRVAEFELADCLQSFPSGNYQTTFKHNGNRQIDWMFASKKFVIKDAKVDYSEDLKDMSDHYPIITDFEI